eukprot:637465-Pleurochrysis_carterae.AAC.1
MKCIINTLSSTLFLGRHLDQLIMCTIYGVCKVNRKQLTFRHIIEQYKRQARASPKVFREVRMRTAEETPQDIITFYNTIYMPAMRGQLYAVYQSAGALADADPLPTSTSPFRG